MCYSYHSLSKVFTLLCILFVLILGILILPCIIMGLKYVIFLLVCIVFSLLCAMHFRGCHIYETVMLTWIASHKSKGLWKLEAQFSQVLGEAASCETEKHLLLASRGKCLCSFKHVICSQLQVHVFKSDALHFKLFGLPIWSVI